MYKHIYTKNISMPYIWTIYGSYMCIDITLNIYVLYIYIYKAYKSIIHIYV